jgi:PAS domain-containing protein
LFGFSRSEPLDFNLFLRRLHPNDRDELSHAIDKALEEASSYEMEYRVILPDGQMRWISSRGR